MTARPDQQDSQKGLFPTSAARTAYSKITPAATGSNPPGQMVSSLTFVQMRFARGSAEAPGIER